jgi:hypothetical protein
MDELDLGVIASEAWQSHKKMMFSLMRRDEL